MDIEKQASDLCDLSWLSGHADPNMAKFLNGVFVQRESLTSDGGMRFSSQQFSKDADEQRIKMVFKNMRDMMIYSLLSLACKEAVMDLPPDYDGEKYRMNWAPRKSVSGEILQPYIVFVSSPLGYKIEANPEYSKSGTEQRLALTASPVIALSMRHKTLHEEDGCRVMVTVTYQKTGIPLRGCWGVPWYVERRAQQLQK